MDRVKQIHAFTLRNSLASIQRLLLDLLQLPIPNLKYAHKLLLSHPSPKSTTLFNSLIASYAVDGPFDKSIDAFSDLRQRCRPNAHTFDAMFAACAAFYRPDHGRALHGLIIIHGLPTHAPLIDMYAKNGFICSARQVFDEIHDRDVHLWNSMVAAYMRDGQVVSALEVFDYMPERNVVSWTVVVSGFVKNGRCEDAVEVFLRMWDGGGVRPNEVTVASGLTACAGVGALGLGERIEEYAREHGFVGDVFVGNALVEMYAKSGDIGQAKRVFDEMGEGRNLCSWNSMIMGYAFHGKWRQSLQLFHHMLVRVVIPDDITFVAVLLACSHGGLVNEGQHVFYSMEKCFSLVPKVEHYGCMIDLLGRAGLLKEAYSLITSMPIEPDAIIWGALLGACSFHVEVQLAEIAAQSLFKLEPWNSGNYVILANIYASLRRWDSVAKVWKLIKEKKQRKSAGYSIIELEGKTHKFLVDDKSHPQYEEVYAALDEITACMKFLEF